MKGLYFLVLVFALVIFFVSKVYAVPVDCKRGSELLINNLSGTFRSYTLDGTRFVLPARGSVVIGCSGIVRITVDADVVYRVFDLNVYFFDWNKSMSFIAGLLTAIAFVVSSSRRF